MISRGGISVHSRRGVDEQPVFLFGTERIGYVQKRMGCWWFHSNGTEPVLYTMTAKSRRALIDEIRAVVFRKDSLHA